jgi:FkbM family methyltransferase
MAAVADNTVAIGAISSGATLRTAVLGAAIWPLWPADRLLPMPDLVDIAARVTRALPARLGTPLAWHIGQRASRKTRIARLRTGGRVATDAGDHLHRSMFFRGEYEPAVTKFLQSVARPGWTVVDVGANVGYFSVLCADLGGPGSHVVAFEPEPRLNAMLERTASVNPQADILVQIAACGSTPGLATLHLSPDDRHSGLATLRSDLHDTRGVQVLVLRLDDFCGAHGIRPDLVKIDAEGFELEVLRGCGYLLEQRIPQHLLVELSPEREDPATTIGLLRYHGYEPFNIGPEGSLTPLGKLNEVYEDVCFVRNSSVAS